MKKKTSSIWKIEKQKLQEIVSSCTSFSKILKYFNLLNKGGNVKTLKSRLDYDSIDYSHIRLVKGSNSVINFIKKHTPLNELFTINSNYNRNHLKRKIIKNKLLLEECQMCGIIDTWNGKHLTLQLDHINGISNDNRLDNLRFLCPNCHSQTDTFSGRKSKNTGM